MQTVNSIALKSSTAARLRRIARANRHPGESVGAALRRLAATSIPGVHKRTGRIIFALGEGCFLDCDGVHSRDRADGWPYNTGWWTLRQQDGHQPKTSATPGCAYGAYHYW